MAGGPVARPYAEAMVEIGQQQGLLDRFREDLEFVGEYVAGDAEFRAFYESPRIDQRVKREVVRKAFGERLHPHVLSLLELLAEKRRQFILIGIIDQYRAMHDEKLGRVAVRLRTARPLGAQRQQAVTGRLASILHKEIRVEEEVDAGLLGGIVLQVGDTVVDGSLKRRLDVLERRLRTTGLDGERFYED